MSKKSGGFFRPKKKQMDYTQARWVPVINCVVKYGEKILVLKRSKKLHLYPGYWNGVSGFLDDEKSLEEKVWEELREEIGITKAKIRKISLGEVFDQEDTKYRKTWVVHPVLVEVTTDKVRLDWEAEEYRWCTFHEVRKLKLLPGFGQVLDEVERLISPLIKLGRYEHYKKKPYQVLGVVKHSETLEDLVLYRPLYVSTLSQLWVRPKKMFLEKVRVNGKTVPRFRFIK